MKNSRILLIIMIASVSADFSFIVTNDMRFGDNEHMMENLRDAMGCIAHKHGDSDFMISPGDNTPVQEIHQIIKDSLGNNFSWYPSVGNHEGDTDSDRVYLKECIGSLRGIANSGPVHAESTMYSFNIEEVHFVCLNVYYDGVNEFSSWKTNGVSDACHEWLANDLETTEKEAILVFGHVPAFVLCDEDTKMEYQMDSDLGLSGGNPENRDRFWTLLKKHNVIAYFCGHQHSYYSENYNGVYQYNAGAISDNSASYDTYIRVVADENTISVESWREYEKNQFTCKETIVHSLTDRSSKEITNSIGIPPVIKGSQFQSYLNMKVQRYLLNGRVLPFNDCSYLEMSRGVYPKIVDVHREQSGNASHFLVRKLTNRE